MTTRMLIDGRHPEETRVVVVNGTRIEEFDFEAEARKQIKGNIYLAKVTRVEPSLQAAFVDYGGNRHGFLAFSEIHPDYYQIPKEDRDALLREERELADEHHDRDDDRADDGDDRGDGDADGDAPRPEESGSGDELSAEALRRKRMALRRRYKIQEVIRRRQVMLVQVVKEERGNKGAALTSYLSLAGRYSVLMPNTAHGGGISRKIANMTDRKRLKQIMADLNLPTSMGAIVRTAGLERTRTEIKRDFDYLTRLWDEIRTTTLASAAPALIYEDSDLIKRAIRDIYSREIDEVLVDGEAGYKHAKDFMKLLMPSHAKKVQPYNDPVPLFQRAAVEGQLAALMNPVVTLKSGGYIVINSTEALVAVDVNSGRSTREYNIEETATKTNIEAAEEVARQLRLRDLAGLVVVDFIDMENNGNNRKVERALKDALKRDRARIQVGRISAFGLLEMSRQRLRTGVLEASTEICPTCDGTGLVRTPASAALAALRLIEEEAVRGRHSLLRLRADRPVAVYMLNRKRRPLAELEERYGVHVEIMPDDMLTGARLVLEPSGPAPANGPVNISLPPVSVGPVEDEFDEDEVEDDADEREESAERGEGRESGRGDRRRRRRGGRGRDRDERPRAEAIEGGEAGAGADAGEQDGDSDGYGDGEQAEASDDGRDPKKRRRRRRNRRDRRDRDGVVVNDENAHDADEGDAPADAADAAPVEAVAGEAVSGEAAPAEKPRRRRGKKVAAEASPVEAPAPVEAEAAVELAEVPAEKPKRRRAKKADVAADDGATAELAPAETLAEEASEAGPVKPRARRTPRKKADAEVMVDVAPEPEVAETPVPQMPVPQAVKPPVGVEPVMASPAAETEADAETDADAESDADGPPRRGWWQRTFGN